MLLWNRLIAPVVPRRCREGPVPLPECLMLWVSICASSIDQDNFQVAQRFSEVRSKRAACWAGFGGVSASLVQEKKKVFMVSYLQ